MAIIWRKQAGVKVWDVEGNTSSSNCLSFGLERIIDEKPLRVWAQGLKAALHPLSPEANSTAVAAWTFWAGRGLGCVLTASSTADGTAASLPAVAHQPLAPPWHVTDRAFSVSFRPSVCRALIGQADAQAIYHLDLPLSQGALLSPVLISEDGLNFLGFPLRIKKKL